MTTKIPGRDLLVFVDGVAIAGQTTCELDVSCEMKEKTSPTTGNFREYRPGRKGWKVSCGTLLLLDTRYDLVELIGKKVRVAFAKSTGSPDGMAASQRVIDTDNPLVYSGEAYLQRGTASARRGDKATTSYEFLGSGPLDSTTDGE